MSFAACGAKRADRGWRRRIRRSHSLATERGQRAGAVRRDLTDICSNESANLQGCLAVRVSRQSLFRTGLSEAEAKRRLARHGANELPSGRAREVWAIAAEVVREPMLLLLVVGAALYFALGDWSEALILLVSVLVVIGITIYQERRTERALEALRDLSSPHALVVRDGEPRRIAGREVVPGDLVLLQEGDRVPADGVLRECNQFTVDESLLTGESLPVSKRVAESEVNEMASPGGEGLPFVYSGSLTVQGQGIARVLATGSSTQMGKVGRARGELEIESAAVQAE